MAITGIDTIEGKQIIAAGAVSAKSAEMAYNDENGNPITGYLTAVPTGTMNESAFGYDASDNITGYNGSAIGGGSYQPSGNYIPYTAIDGKAFKTNSGLKIATFIGSELRTNLINNNFITLQSVNSTLGINNQVILATGSLTLKTKSDSAYVDREKIHKWDSASDYIQNNSAALNEVSAKLDTTAFSTVSSDFYTTANESGFITGVPTGTMNESAFEYDANDKISGYNGSAFAGGSDVPEGVMVESGLEYNAVNEISGYNGSAIAQYGAEKQWLVHDDTLVHASNSAQYALGVAIDNVARLMGVDETVLFSGTPSTSINLAEQFSNFETIKITAHAQEQNIKMTQIFEFPGTNSAFDLHIYNYNSNGTSIVNYLTRYNVNGLIFSASIIKHWWQATGAITGGTWAGPGSSPIIPVKVVGVHRISG